MDNAISFDNLIQVAEKNQKYLNGESDTNGKETIDMTWNAVNILRQNIPEIKGGFGVGFPFYSISKSGELIYNPEFDNYSKKFIEKVNREKAMGSIAWACVQCQSDHDYCPTRCKDCTGMLVKPRDVMKVMPDIDLFLISDDVSSETLNKVQDIAKQNRFHQSDYNSLETLQRINRVFDNFDQNKKGDYLPTDMHIISKKEFCSSLDKIGRGDLDFKTDIYSMYYDWTLDEGFDLAFDFIFSGTFNPEICDPEIVTLVNQARKNLVSSISENDILEVIKMKSKRADVLLSHEPTRNIFLDKIRSWSKL